jgi:antitoxin (DNA-binding transcriptional repressor) of toxin-antitoxin stability system
VTQANDSLGQSVRKLEGEPLVVTEDGVPIAALVAIDELDLESLALGSHPRFMAILDEARAQCRQGLGLSLEGVMLELGLDADTRAGLKR